MTKELTYEQKLYKAITTAMEYRTPEEHKIISSAAYKWLNFIELIGGGVNDQRN